ncbi:MAG: hypothetical protein A2Z25_22005 [Planctomycetes bacterium RBG_16_55_9]|nr:MAG: hypothetical protein A2Z25_22005 [Planctomycetes bacterium RBG_16_55_9]
MSEWEINKPLGQCYGSGRKIEYGEEYFGALVKTEEGLQRRDFCADYWEKEKPEVFCYWKTKLPQPGQRKPLFVDDQMLMAFFERLEKETEQEKMNFRFVLALILMRKRILKYEDTATDNGREIWRLRIVGDKQIAEVINPHLDEEQVGQLSSQIGEILQADL